MTGAGKVAVRTHTHRLPSPGTLQSAVANTTAEPVEISETNVGESLVSQALNFLVGVVGLTAVVLLAVAAFAAWSLLMGFLGLVLEWIGIDLGSESPDGPACNDYGHPYLGC